MHFCADELMALLAAVPFLGFLGRKFHSWWHQKTCKHAAPISPVGHNPDPVRYYDEAEVARLGQDGRTAGDITGPGWYFFEETWAICHGPYKTEKEARQGLKRYCREFLDGPSPAAVTLAAHHSADPEAVQAALEAEERRDRAGGAR